MCYEDSEFLETKSVFYFRAIIVHCAVLGEHRQYGQNNGLATVCSVSARPASVAKYVYNILSLSFSLSLFLQRCFILEHCFFLEGMEYTAERR